MKEPILKVWEDRKAEAQREASWADARANTIRQKQDRLEQAYIFEQAIDAESYERHRDRLRQELTLAQIDRHSTALEELDVQGILAFAERLLPSAANIWLRRYGLLSNQRDRLWLQLRGAI